LAKDWTHTTNPQTQLHTNLDACRRLEPTTQYFCVKLKPLMYVSLRVDLPSLLFRTFRVNHMPHLQSQIAE